MGNLKMKPGTWYMAPVLIHDMELSKNARLIYSYFCRLSILHEPVFPSYPKIMKGCTIRSRTSIRKGLKELESCGLLEVKVRYSKDGTRLTNLYEVVRPNEIDITPELQPIVDILKQAPKDEAKLAQAAAILQQFFNSDETKPETDDATSSDVSAAATEPKEESKEEQSSDKTSTEEKEPIADNGLKYYGHHKYVYLTDEEYKRLIDDYGANTAVAFIDQLDSRIASDGGPEKCKYIGNYATVRRWIKKDYENRQGRSSWEKDETHRRIMGNSPTEPYFDHTLEPFENDP